MVCPRSGARTPLPRTARAVSGWDSGAAASRVPERPFYSVHRIRRRAAKHRSIHVDRTGRLWIGGGDGLRRVDAPESDRPAFVRYTTAQGLTSNAVSSITDDLEGRVYLGMTSGVDRLDPLTGAVRHVALPDALTGREVEVAFCDRQGTLWFGTSRGLVSLVPASDRPGSPPTVLIGGLRISGEPRAISELGETHVPALELASNQNQVQVDFFSVSTASPVVRYQPSSRTRTRSGASRQTSAASISQACLPDAIASWFGRSPPMGSSVRYPPASTSALRRPSGVGGGL